MSAAAFHVPGRRRHRRRTGRFHRLDAARPARAPRPAVRARDLPALPHRRVAHPRDLLGAEAAQHAGQDEGQPLRPEAQRAVRQRQRQAVGAVLLLGQQAARVLADVAGRARRVRPDAARERARARRRRPRGRARARGDLRGRARRRREDPGARRHAPRGAGAGRRRRQRPGGDADEPLRPAHLGSAPQQGRDLDLLRGRGQGRQPRRGRHAGRADARQARLVVEHPAARRSPQLRHRPAVRGHLQEPRRPRADLPRGGREHAVHQAPRRQREADHRLLRDPRLHVSLDASWPATAGCWSATPSASSIRSTRRA